MRRRTPHIRAQTLLLRIWEERSEQAPDRVLRLSVETPRGERRGFADPEALARYLSDVAATLARDADAAEGDEGGRQR
jgi:hypothetical protein